MIKGILLMRVSTKRQEEEGLSLDNQLKTLEEYSLEHGIEIVKKFSFSESADIKTRKKFNEMIEFVKSSPEIQAIVGYRVDRLTRNFRDAVLIDDLRLNFRKEIHFVHDRLVINARSVGREIQDWDLKVFLAKQTINRLKEDAYETAEYKLRNYEWPNKAPYGYQNIQRADNKKWIEIDPFEGGIVRKMYEWYASGSFSMFTLRNKIKGEFGKSFSIGKIDFILKNHFYHGDMCWNGVLHPHKYETIITKELFDQVQSVKAGFHKKHSKFAGLPYVYRGLIKCGDCGCAITPEKKKGKYVYYHCTEYNGKHGAKWVREEDITNQFAEVFKSIKVPQDVADEIVKTLKESHSAKVDFVNNLVEDLHRQHKIYETRIEKMYEDQLDGRITRDMYDKKYKEYREKQANLEQKLHRIQKADDTYYMSAEGILQLANRAYSIFMSSEGARKVQLINMVLQNFVLKGNKVHYELIKPFDTILFCKDHHTWLPD